jgi:dolichol kinase
MRKPQTRKQVASRKITFELKRKTVHIALGILIALLIYFDVFFLPMWVGILFLFVIFSYSLKKKEDFPLISRFAISLEKESEKKFIPVKGAIVFIFSCILSYIIFSKFIAIAAIMTLFIGDSAAAFYGMLFGKIRSKTDPKKHIDAGIVGAVINTIFIVLFLSFNVLNVFMASLVVFLIESLFPFSKIKNQWLSLVVDDNLIIPLVFGIGLSLL